MANQNQTLLTRENIMTQSLDFLYSFLKTEYITPKYYGKWTNIIYKKHIQQTNYMKGIAAWMSGDQQQNFNVIKRWILDGMAENLAPIKNPETGKYEEATPALVLSTLATGQPVGSLNWKAGVFGVKNQGGVGEAEGKQTLEELGYSFDTKKGVVRDSQGRALYAENTYYNGNLMGRNFVDYNNQAAFSTNYNSQYNSFNLSGLAVGKDDPQWLQDTYSCVQMFAMLVPMITNAVTSIKQAQGANMAQVNPAAIAPSQTNDGWSVPEESSSSGLLLGGLLLGGGLLLATSGNGNKKHK